jgi:hypothetical protein
VPYVELAGDNWSGVGFRDLSSFSPAHLPALAMWMRADRGISLNAGNVSAWNDQSSNARHATQGTAGAQPPWRSGSHASAINGRPVVDFDGTADYLAWGNVFTTLTGGGEIFVVARGNNDPPSVGAGALWFLGSDTLTSSVPFTDGVIYDAFGSTARKTTVNPTPSLAQPFIYNVTSVAGQWTSRLNGTQIHTTGTNTVGWTTAPTLGRGGNITLFFAGVVAEIIMTAGAMSTASRDSVLRYLRARYGIA